MIILVKVIARAKQENIEKMPDGSYKVRVRPAARDGQANQRVIELLAEYFHRPKSEVIIRRGQSSPRKQIEIL